MKAGVLYSGGKDSSLAAILLGTYYEVELNTFVFDPLRHIPTLEAAADVLGYPLKKRVFAEGMLNEMADLIIAKGYPNDAINAVHQAAIESLAAEYYVVGDGTRFDDRVPMLSRETVQSLMSRTGCSYVRPLLGYPRHEVDRLADQLLVVQYGETGRSGMAITNQRSRMGSGPAGSIWHPCFRHITSSRLSLAGKHK